jgi:transketolase
MKINPLKKRILEICYKYKISHIGSFVSAVDIIDEIFSKKTEDDIFILSSGHAGLALYVVLEKYLGLNAEELYLKHGLHPHRDLADKIYCSTGSLGTGITIGVGSAIANKNKKVYVLSSDGESYEGSFWESLNFISENKIDNLFLYVNANGFAAYKSVDVGELKRKIASFDIQTDNKVKVVETDFGDMSFLNGLSAHYKTLTQEDWEQIKAYDI